MMWDILFRCMEIPKSWLIPFFYRLGRPHLSCWTSQAWAVAKSSISMSGRSLVGIRVTFVLHLSPAPFTIHHALEIIRFFTCDRNFDHRPSYFGNGQRHATITCELAFIRYVLMISQLRLRDVPTTCDQDLVRLRNADSDKSRRPNVSSWNAVRALSACPRRA